MKLSALLSNHYKFILIMVGLLFVAVAPIMPVEALVLAVGLVFATAVYFNPKWAVGLMLLILPFSNTPLLKAQLIGFLPLKLFVIVFAVLFAVILFKYKINLRTYFDLKYLVLFVVYIMIFAFSVIRAVDYIEYISIAWQDDLSFVRMMSNLLVTPLIMLLPAVIVLLYYNYEDSKQLLNAFVLSIFVLSVTILFVYVFMSPSLMNFSAIRRQIKSVLNMHGNDIANFYIMTFPVLLAMYLNKRSLLIRLAFFVSLFAIAILFSRTAYVCVIFTFVAFGFLRGRIDSRFFGVLAMVLIGMLFLPAQVYDRFASLIVGSDVNTLTAGRTDYIWIPLWLDWTNESFMTQLFGIGRYSIVESFAYRTGIILDVKHPHNMYLESLMDIGVLGLLSYLFIYIYLGWQVFVAFLREKTGYDKDILFGIVISFGLFLLSGLSGRTMFPSILNAFEWVLLALGIIIIRHQQSPTPAWKKR